ncbi:MAG: DNA-3-methyladenine glycosylase [Candidatus Nanohaloarchaea archaeon]
MRKESFYARDPVRVARDLLGDFLVRDGLKGRIVETEAYRGEQDPASHASSGRTDRNDSMYGPPGTAYVYVCYGVHQMLNFVTGTEGEPSAVLIRAVEPLKGVEEMRDNRGVREEGELCSGPGKLCEAFDISKKLDGQDLFSGPLHVEEGSEEEYRTSDRVGVDSDHEIRFYVPGNRHVSR